MTLATIDQFIGLIIGIVPDRIVADDAAESTQMARLRPQLPALLFVFCRVRVRVHVQAIEEKPGAGILLLDDDAITTQVLTDAITPEIDDVSDFMLSVRNDSHRFELMNDAIGFAFDNDPNSPSFAIDLSYVADSQWSFDLLSCAKRHVVIIGAGGRSCRPGLWPVSQRAGNPALPLAHKPNEECWLRYNEFMPKFFDKFLTPASDSALILPLPLPLDTETGRELVAALLADLEDNAGSWDSLMDGRLFMTRVGQYIISVNIFSEGDHELQILTHAGAEAVRVRSQELQPELNELLFTLSMRTYTPVHASSVLDKIFDNKPE